MRRTLYMCCKLSDQSERWKFTLVPEMHTDVMCSDLVNQIRENVNKCKERNSRSEALLHFLLFWIGLLNKFMINYRKSKNEWFWIYILFLIFWLRWDAVGMGRAVIAYSQIKRLNGWWEERLILKINIVFILKLLILTLANAVSKWLPGNDWKLGRPTCIFCRMLWTKSGRIVNL